MTNNQIIARALGILEERATYGDVMSSPLAVKDYCRLRLADLEHEVFAALWLDSQNRLIKYEELFRGTLSQTAVYPREVVKSALAHNAASVIFTHNHPSGSLEPSTPDKMLTDVLKNALALIDVKVCDHIIVTLRGATGFAELGYL